MKKALMASVLSIFLGVGVLFGGCGTDLSGINSQINELKQQIASLTQTILELQTELQNAKGDISSLQSQLAIASANYDKLYNQVYGIDNNYQQLNETTSYSHNGNILFDFKPTRAVIGAAGAVMEYEFISHIKGFSTFEDFKLTALLYTDNTKLTYTVIDSGVDFQGNNFIRFTPNDFDNTTQTGLVYIFISNLIFAKYEFNFV